MKKGFKTYNTIIPFKHILNVEIIESDVWIFLVGNLTKIGLGGKDAEQFLYYYEQYLGICE